MLEEYGRKRDFSKTQEPKGSGGPIAGGPLRFVVQKHAARALHYDFRLEVDGVLKSWPIPKGPSLDPHDKRLAVMTEDHPLDYASFEGVIPKGEYGGGQVIVWDAGLYGPVVDDVPCFERAEAERLVRRGIEQGKLSVHVHGRKMRGVWTLVRKKGDEWLFIKHKDATADPERDLTKLDASVLSDLTIDDLKAGRLPVPEDARPLLPDLGALPGAKRGKPPATLAPMLPTLTERAFSNPDWLFEPKLDGYRMLAVVQDGEVKLISRTGKDSGEQFPWVADLLRHQPLQFMVLDGEIVALDGQGQHSFQELQNRVTTEPAAYRYYAFDLLFADGFDLRGVPLTERKAALDALVVPGGALEIVESVAAEGEALYRAATGLGLEGVVAKRADSRYESGKRSTAWLKVKAVQTADFIIGGYTAGQGNRSDTLGALLLGTPMDDGKGLRYVGHVGTGFDERGLRELMDQLEALHADTSPFAEPIPAGGRWTRKDRGATTWVQPKLVAEVKFAERTRDGILRAPIFLRLRDDLRPSDTKPVALAAVPDAPRRLAGNELEETVEAVLEQLREKRTALTVDVDGQAVEMTNLDKPFWPAHGRTKAVTKRDVATYLVSVSPWLLPHLRSRPLTLIRYPNGIEGQKFYQRHWEHTLPPFVETVSLYVNHAEADDDFLMCNNLPTLLWLAQIGCLELHSWYSRTDREPDARQLPVKANGSAAAIDASVLNYPDFIVFDLDPYRYSGKEAEGDEPELHKTGFDHVRKVALWLKELLDSVKLPAYVKTSGKTGLHIFVPIRRTLSYVQTHALAEALANHLVQEHPKQVTVEWAVKNRGGKIFADYNQNVRGKTLASIFSPRVLAQAAVSMPLRWEELESSRLYPTQFTLRNAVKRLQEQGDVWADILEQKCDVQNQLGLIASAG